MRGWAGKGLARDDLRRKGVAGTEAPPESHDSLSYLLCAPHRVETLFPRRDLTSPWMLVRGDSDAAVVYSDSSLEMWECFTKRMCSNVTEVDKKMSTVGQTRSQRTGLLVREVPVRRVGCGCRKTLL